MLLSSEAPAAFWQRVALSTWFEPNDQINHYIYTTISSLIHNKDPLRRHLTLVAESILPLAKPMLWTSHSASKFVMAGFSERSRVGYRSEAELLPGFESFLPLHVRQNLILILGPMIAKLADVSVSGKHVEKLVDYIFGKPNIDDGSAFSAGPELWGIHEELKILARATGQPELYVNANLMDMYQRFVSVNMNDINKVG